MDSQPASYLTEQREHLIMRELARLGVTNQRVLDAMNAIPREKFLPPSLEAEAYLNEAIPIGLGQTISQPLMVGIMLQAMSLLPKDRVLEVGTGSGYAAAILAKLASEVYTIERHAELAKSACDRLDSLGIRNVQVRVGDGCLGWPEAAPFDAIVVAAGGPNVPRFLLEQLAIGGRLVIPVGPNRESQHLFRVTRTAEKQFEKEKLDAVRFVPLIGAEAWSE